MKWQRRKQAWAGALFAQSAADSALDELTASQRSAKSAYGEMQDVLDQDIPDGLRAQWEAAEKAVIDARRSSRQSRRCLDECDRNTSAFTYQIIKQQHERVTQLAAEADKLLSSVETRCDGIINGPVGLRKRLDLLYDLLEEAEELYDHLFRGNYRSGTLLAGDIGNTRASLGRVDAMIDGDTEAAACQIELAARSVTAIRDTLQLRSRQSVELEFALSTTRRTVEWAADDLKRTQAIFDEILAASGDPDRTQAAATAMREATTLLMEAQAAIDDAAGDFELGSPHWDDASTRLHAARQLGVQLLVHRRIVHRIKRQLDRERANRPADS